MPSTTLATFTVTGFTGSTQGLPKGVDATLERIAKLLDANRTAGVVMQPTATRRAYARAGLCTERVIERIRDLMAGDAEAKTDRRFGHGFLLASEANEVMITVRRPTAL